MNRRGGLAELLMGGLALVLALAILVALLVFSLVAFTVVAMAALLLFGYVWWKARRTRASGGGAPDVPGKGPL
jgi:hypothetical protein